MTSVKSYLDHFIIISLNAGLNTTT